MPEEPPTIPPVYFNHLYLVLDDKTYRAIIASDFLRIAFPGQESRATRTAAGESWSGAYFYTQENYLEFFSAGHNPLTGSTERSGHWQPGAQEGWAGLAFSVDTASAASAVRQTLQSAYHSEPFNELRQLVTPQGTINWFYNLKLAERLSMGSFDSWLMAYHPDIFTYKGIPLPEDGKLTRQAYLSPWNQPRSELAGGKTRVESSDPQAGRMARRPQGLRQGEGTTTQHHPEPPQPPQVPVPQPVFSRITSATFHMDERRASRFAETLSLLGYTQSNADGRLTLSAQGFSLHIEAEENAPGGYRLSRLRLAMTRPSVAPMTFIFAPRSRLILNADLTADWYFGV